MDRKQQIRDYIVVYITAHGYPPTVREICDGVGLYSTSSVQHYLTKMLELGMIETDAPGSPRAIRVPGMGFVKGSGGTK